MPLIVNDQDDSSYVKMAGDFAAYNKLEACFGAEASTRFAGSVP